MGSELSTEERLTRLETKLENIENFLIRLEAKMDAREQHYVTREVMDEKLKRLEDKCETLQKALNQISLDKQTNKTIFPSWISNVVGLGALIVAVLTIVYK